MKRTTNKTSLVVLGTLLVVAIGLSVQSCNEDDKIRINSQEQKNIVSFEKNLVKSISTRNDVILLVGFKTIYVKDLEERSRIIELSKEKKTLKGLSNCYFADDGSFYRVYFPLHTAIVEYKGEKILADNNGFIKNEEINDIAQINIVGRQRSETVQGTGSNIIKDDLILLKNRIKQETIDGTRIASSYEEEKAFIVDLGERSFGKDTSCCSTTNNTLKRGYEGDDSHGVSCNSNHGGQNCSSAFGINEGRCSFNSNVCMDYNGYYTDCINGKASNFVGSDCFFAMARGHCWNELM